MVINDQLFHINQVETEKKDLLTSIVHYLGHLPRNLYDKYSGFEKFKVHTADHPSPDAPHRRLRELLATEHYNDGDMNDFIKFLLFIFNYDPSKRPTPAECLEHEWLNPPVVELDD